MLRKFEALTRKCWVGQEHVSLLFPCRTRLQAASVAVGVQLPVRLNIPDDDEMAREEREALAALGDFILPQSYGRTEADDDEDDFECEDYRRERRKQEGY